MQKQRQKKRICPCKSSVQRDKWSYIARRFEAGSQSRIGAYACLRAYGPALRLCVNGLRGVVEKRSGLDAQDEEKEPWE